MSPTVAGTRTRAWTRRLRRPGLLAVVAIAGAGLALRLVVLHSAMGVLDSDEAVVGLMATGFQHGHFRAMYWGQSYGGTIEQALAAVVFSIAGVSTTARPRRREAARTDPAGPGLPLFDAVSEPAPR